MSELIYDNVNDLPFKLRFTSTQKMTKELIKLIGDRREVLDRLVDEYELLGRHKTVLANIKQRLETCHEALREIRSLCQCHSDEDRASGEQQLATSEENLNKTKDKINKIQLIKCIDVEVRRLPSNWRATLIRIQRQRLAHQKAADAEVDPEDKTGDNEELKEEKNDENRAEDETSRALANTQFEIDLERKIYETQVEELLQLIQQLVMKTKTMRARIDISKQLIKAVLKYKRELEANNSALKESMATCHCAEAGDPEDQELQNKLAQKRRLEETVAEVSVQLKRWEEEYSLLKESQNKPKVEPKSESPVQEPSSAQALVAQPMTTTVVQVANEEEVAHDYSQVANTSQSCMFASQGTANPAVIYLEGLVAAQQPTYIPAQSMGSAQLSAQLSGLSGLSAVGSQQLGVYPQAYALSAHQTMAHSVAHNMGHSVGPHHSYAHQAPDGSIQVYSSDTLTTHTTHPSYIAYQ